MEFESISDQKGKEHMVFNSLELNVDEFMGDKFEDFELLQLLGEGSYGKVVKVSSKINQKIYATKILNLEHKEDEGISKEEKEKYFTSEIELLKVLNHPNIVKYYKSFKEKNNLYIIMEYFDNGDLETYIKVLEYNKNKNYLEKEEIWSIFYQCISGLNYLHSKGVVHRNIKPQNILMSKNKIIKIGDFEVSALFQESKDMKEEMKKIHKASGSLLGTQEYMAPELFKKKYNEKIDIFSMGCVFYKVCFLKNYQKREFMKEGDFLIRKMISEEIPKNIDNNIIDIISEMTNIEVEKRPDSKYFLQKIKENYNKIFIQNSGIYSVLRCMINLPYLRNHFLTKYKNLQKINTESESYSNKFLFFIENENNWIENLTFYRHKIIEENNFLNNNKEINPYLILTFILDKIHGELNQVKKLPENSLLKKRNPSIDPMKENIVKREYINMFRYPIILSDIWNL